MIEIKINKRMANHAVGDIVSVPGDDGVPLETFWRRRLIDAEVDGCCEIVMPALKAAPVLRKSEPVIEDTKGDD